MHDELIVHVLHGLADLEGSGGYVLFFQAVLLFLDAFVQGAFLQVFKDQIDVLGVVKETVQFGDVRMVQEHLQLDFEDHLVAHL